MNLAYLVKCLKKHAKNRRITDETILNELLHTYIEAAGITDKNGEIFYFDKSRTSLLLNRHDDIPGILRNALAVPDLFDYTKDNMEEFIEEFLKSEEIDLVMQEVREMILEEKSIADKNRFWIYKDDTSAFLTLALIESIKLKNNGIDPEGEIIRNGAYAVKVEYADIFKHAFRRRAKEPCIVVIPVDTEFRTHVTRNYEKSPFPEVSAKTLHGQWLTRWEQSGENISDLNERIAKSIENKHKIRKSKAYPVGTIAVLEGGNTIFYLLAISEFDSNNNAHSSKKDIKDAIGKLAEFYDKYGEGYNLYIPLLGTGKSRSSLSLQESYDAIVDYYLNNRFHIQGNITIVIYKEQEKLVDIKKEDKENVQN